MKKKFLSALLAIAILATSLPLNLFSAVTAGGDNEAAAPGVYNGESVTKDGVTLSKEAVQVGLDEYEITLKLTGGGTALERQPMELVFALDSSSSMVEKVKVTKRGECGETIRRYENTTSSIKSGDSYWEWGSLKRPFTETETMTVTYRCDDGHVTSTYTATRTRRGTQTYWAFGGWQVSGNPSWSDWKWSSPDKNIEGQKCKTEVTGTGTESVQRIKRARSAMKELLRKLYDNKIDARIRMIHFAGNSEELTSGWIDLMKEQDGALVSDQAALEKLLSMIDNGWRPLTGGDNDSKRAIYGKTGGTNIQQALSHADSLFSAGNEVPQNLLLVSDGGPTTYNNGGTIGYWCGDHSSYCSYAAQAALNKATAVKNAHRGNPDFSLYAVAVDITGDSAKKFFPQLASPGCSLEASSDELSGEFMKFVTKITQLVNDGVVTDPMGEDVDLKDVSGVTVSPSVLYDDDGKALPADQ